MLYLLYYTDIDVRTTGRGAPLGQRLTPNARASTARYVCTRSRRLRPLTLIAACAAVVRTPDITITIQDYSLFVLAITTLAFYYTRLPYFPLYLSRYCRMKLSR